MKVKGWKNAAQEWVVILKSIIREGFGGHWHLSRYGELVSVSHSFLGGNHPRLRQKHSQRPRVKCICESWDTKAAGYLVGDKVRAKQGWLMGNLVGHQKTCHFILRDTRSHWMALSKNSDTISLFVRITCFCVMNQP